MYYKKDIVFNHVRDNATIYVFMIILFLTGIIFGAVIVNSMNFIQKQDLIFYLERFFGNVTDGKSITKTEILKSSFLYHVKYLMLLFILGLSVIGLPIAWILIFLKGLVVGFSVGFIVNQLGIKGFLFASLSIAPQNLLVIPIYIVAGSLSMIFSLEILNKLFSRKMSHPVFQSFGKYITLFTILISISFSAALIEAFVANEAMEMFIKSNYFRSE